ncbi:MAG: Secretion system C-terminal sorting domain, partial [Bacteroidota bacterium]
CAQYVDCAGEPFGLAQADCNGDCNGTALVGDLDYDGSQTYSDAVSYVEHILGNDIQALPCTDIDQDGNITVTEAALMARCQYWNEAHEHPDSSGVHDKCTFPVVEIINPFDSVGFSIGQVNWEQGYFDVYVINPDNRIIGYELVFSGLGIQSAVSLADPIGYPITPSFTPGGNRLIGLSYDNMSFIKNYVWVPLVRIYWSSIGDEICISEVVDVVNDSYHNTVHWIENGCLMANGVSEFTTLDAMLHPNPMTESALLRFSNPAGDVFELELVDAQGRVVQEQSGAVSQFEITREGLAPGTYLYRLMGGNGWATGRLSVQ